MGDLKTLLESRLIGKTPGFESGKCRFDPYLSSQDTFFVSPVSIAYAGFFIFPNHLAVSAMG